MDKLDKYSPVRPADYAIADVAALQALHQGNATAEQQQRALSWIVNSLCKTYDLSYRPNSERDTVFAEGKRHTGMQIVKLLNLSIREMKETDKDVRNRHTTGTAKS